MYIRIKTPARSTLLVQLFTLGTLLAVFLMIGVVFMLVSGDITSVWKEALNLFYDLKQEKGLLSALLCVFAILMIPVGLLSVIWQWCKQRRRWNSPTFIYALGFNPDGITLYTRQQLHFLPYAETNLSVNGELITVRTKNNSHAALHALTLTFEQDNNRFQVHHKPTSQFLYHLADLHPHLKNLSFDFSLSAPEDADQQELAAFLKEQLENQRRYGLHCRYRSYLTLILFSLLFIALGTGALGLVLVGFDPHLFMAWVFLVLGLGILLGGLALMGGILQDMLTARKLKQLRHLN